MSKINIQYWQSPVGELILGVYENQLCLCDWKNRQMRSQIDSRIQKALKTDYQEQSHVLITKTIKELTEYFNEERDTFDIPLNMVGSAFQMKVWNLLIAIPYGEIQTYKDLSLAYGNLKAIRAVASANGANAISILVPCHRIIGSNRELVGYAGGLKTKESLLKLEGSLSNDQLELF